MTKKLPTFMKSPIYIIFVFLLSSTSINAFANPSAEEIRRLSLQNRIDGNAPLISATWIGTHNSYNNDDKGYVIPNNKVNMIDQLNAGFRILNYDLHYAYHDIRLCHSSYSSYLCGAGDTPLGNALDRLRDWLRNNPDEVIMIGVEDQMYALDFTNPHNLAADKIERKLKDFIYAPKWHRPADAGKCQTLPITELTKQDVLDSGKQVIVASFTGCKNTSDRWQKWVWELDIAAYKGNEGPNANDLNHSQKLSSVYEDRAFGSGPVDTLSDNQVKTSLKKGANIIALDFGVKINRHPGAIWSWAASEPNGGTAEDCVSVASNGSWADTNCNNHHAYACQNMANGQWVVSASIGDWFDGDSVCSQLSGDYIFAAPTNAQENSRLANTNNSTVWVNASDLAGENFWQIHNFRYEKLLNGNSVDLSMTQYRNAASKDEYFAFYRFASAPASQPSVFLSVPSTNAQDPGILVINGLDKERAKVQFLEWDYQDNNHEKESFDMLAMEDGVYRMSDASIWEVGQFKIDDTATLLDVRFKNNFANKPYLFLTIQGPKNSDRVIVRANKLTLEGFQAALYEQEKKNDGHGAVSVSYLAILPKDGKLHSTINTASGNVSYSLLAKEMNNNWNTVGYYDYFLQEEQSLDSEVSHVNETVHVLTLGDIQLAQVVTIRGGDTVALRRHPNASHPDNRDSDNDGMSDNYEINISGTNPYGQNLCNEQKGTIFGTSGSDTIRGTNNADVILSFGGNDTIYGDGGEDTICAGDGNDYVEGNGSADTIFGGGGSDVLKGNDGRDNIYGDNDNDSLYGNDGRDSLHGGNGHDNCQGGNGNDSFSSC